MTRRLPLIAGCCAALLSTALLATSQAAPGQITPIDGIGDPIAQTVDNAEFALYESTTPSIVFNYQLSSTPASIFLSDPSFQFGSSGQPLTTAEVQSYSRGAANGPLIQIPAFGYAVALAYDNPALTSRLRLTDAQFCGILSGQITDWSSISKTTGTIGVFYRADQDGTTWLLSQHAHAVCTSSDSAFGTYPVPVTSLFSQMFRDNTVPPGFTEVTGAAELAATMAATPLSFGYLTPDRTAIAPMSPNTTTLKVASLVNGIDGKPYTPGTINTSLGLANPGPGSANTVVPKTAAAAADVLDWIPSVPVTNKGYSIVGYSDWLLVTCNGSKSVDNALTGFLKDHYSNSAYATIRKNNGFVLVPAAFSNAVKTIILSNQKKFNLNIGNPQVCPNG
jgi:ABC-type phosphate transport system substrate-binding protein